MELSRAKKKESDNDDGDDDDDDDDDDAVERAATRTANAEMKRSEIAVAEGTR